MLLKLYVGSVLLHPVIEVIIYNNGELCGDVYMVKKTAARARNGFLCVLPWKQCYIHTVEMQTHICNLLFHQVLMKT